MSICLKLKTYLHWQTNWINSKKNKIMSDKENKVTEENPEGNNAATVEQNENSVEENQNETQDSTEEKVELTAEEKLAAADDKYLRLFSEFENFRKRTQKEKGDLISATKADVFKLILPILDDFERAQKSVQEAQDVQSLKEGVTLIHQKLTQSLKSNGLTAMDVAGNEFNADEHEAITNIPAPSEDLKGKIVDVVETGYILNDKIIRYPKVVVGN